MSGDTGKPKILVVDDVECIQLMYRQAFIDEGFELRFAKFGEEALEIYRDWHPHLIILDIKLPDMTGIQVLARIRESDKATPVIMSTAFNMAELVRQAAGLGISHFLAKPVDIDNMLERINKILGLGQAAAPVTEKDRETLIRKLYPQLKQDALALLKILIGDNEEEMLKLQAKELLDDVLPLEGATLGPALDVPALVTARASFALRASRLRRTLKHLEGKGKNERLLAAFRSAQKSLNEYLGATAYLVEGEAPAPAPAPKAEPAADGWSEQ